MDKWKRIIEPAGDSESSGWSSDDSNASCSLAHYSLREYYKSKMRTHSQEGRVNSRNEANNTVEGWQSFSPSYRNQPKKRCLSNVTQVNVNCATSVVTLDSDNEEPANLEENQSRTGIYDTRKREWEIESNENIGRPYRKRSRYKPEFFGGASTSFKVTESSSHSGIGNRSSAEPPSIEVRSTCVAPRESEEPVQTPGTAKPAVETAEKEATVENLSESSAAQPVLNGANDIEKTTPDPTSSSKVSEGPTVEIPTENAVNQKEADLLPNLNLNQSLISLLECPVCMEYVFPPINQCKRGHLICASCKPQLSDCPTCRSRFTETRNLAMEQVAEKLCFPCRNNTSGCKGMYLLQDKKEHEANCLFRTYKCIVSHCMWKGFRPDILEHMVDVHKKIVVYGENQVLRIKLDTCVHFTQNWIVSTFGQVFRVNFLVSYLRSQIAGCVQYLGPRKHASNFSYTFDVCTENRRLLYSRQTHGDSGRLLNVYNTGDCFFLRTDAANYFVTDKVIKVVLQIKKTADLSE